MDAIGRATSHSLLAVQLWDPLFIILMPLEHWLLVPGAPVLEAGVGLQRGDAQRYSVVQADLACGGQAKSKWQARLLCRSVG